MHAQEWDKSHRKTSESHFGIHSRVFAYEHKQEEGRLLSEKKMQDVELFIHTFFLQPHSRLCTWYHRVYYRYIEEKEKKHGRRELSGKLTWRKNGLNSKLYFWDDEEEEFKKECVGQTVITYNDQRLIDINNGDHCSVTGNIGDQWSVVGNNADQWSVERTLVLSDCWE